MAGVTGPVGDEVAAQVYDLRRTTYPRGHQTPKWTGMHNLGVTPPDKLHELPDGSGPHGEGGHPDVLRKNAPAFPTQRWGSAPIGGDGEAGGLSKKLGALL